MYLGHAREEHAPLYCPFTPQIWAAQLLLNVYSLGNWLHPVKVTSSCCCCYRCSSSTTLVTFLSQSAHPNLDNISITLQARSQYLSRFCVSRLWGCVHKNKGIKQPRHPTLTSCSGADAFGAHLYQGWNTIIWENVSSQYGVTLTIRHNSDKLLTLTELLSLFLSYNRCIWGGGGALWA